MDNNLFDANEDILCIMQNVKSIGWKSLRDSSIQRIMYLSKVLYSFTHSGQNIFSYYHFSTGFYGPYASLIYNSIDFLKSNLFLKEDDQGNLMFNRESPAEIDTTKNKWIKTIILILGKYGEDRIFGFTINDPLYKDAISTNLQRELDTDSTENKTIQTLKEFKQAFEETLHDTSSISSEEYIDLYFEYIFSQIIK